MASGFSSRTVTILIFTALLSACGDNTYEEGNFDRYQDMADRNADEAIEHLRKFVYFNPEHYDAHLLLADLLSDRGEQNPRDFYIARHYLNQASQLDVEPEKRSRAAQLLTQVRLQQGVDPDSPGELTGLADQLADQDHHEASAEMYLRAAWLQANGDDLRSAQNNTQQAREQLAKTDATVASDDFEWLQYNAQTAGVAVMVLRRQSEDAVQALPNEEHDEYQDIPFAAPKLDFLGETTALIYDLNARSGWGRQSLDAVRGWFGTDEDESGNGTDFETRFERIQEADLQNEDLDSPRLDRMMGRLWQRLTEELESGGEEEKAARAKRRAVFYFRRAGEVNLARDMED